MHLHNEVVSELSMVYIFLVSFFWFHFSAFFDRHHLMNMKGCFPSAFVSTFETVTYASGMMYSGIRSASQSIYSDLSDLLDFRIWLRRLETGFMFSSNSIPLDLELVHLRKEALCTSYFDTA